MAAPKKSNIKTPDKAMPSVCTTCSGHGSTNHMPGTKTNAEKMYNESPSGIVLGLPGGNMGRSCTDCGGKGMKF